MMDILFSGRVTFFTDTLDSSKLTQTEKQEIEASFKSKLPDGTDGLSQKLAREALFLLKLHPTALEVSKCWADMGKKDEELLSLVEFQELLCKLHEDTESVMRWAFNKFDVNNDGTMDKEELKKKFINVYDDEHGDLVDDDFVNHVLTMADSNNDGVLQIEEFIDMIMERTGRSRSAQSSVDPDQPTPL